MNHEPPAPQPNDRLRTELSNLGQVKLSKTSSGSLDLPTGAHPLIGSDRQPFVRLAQFDDSAYNQWPPGDRVDEYVPRSVCRLARVAEYHSLSTLATDTRRMGTASTTAAWSPSSS